MEHLSLCREGATNTTQALSSRIPSTILPRVSLACSSASQLEPCCICSQEPVAGPSMALSLGLCLNKLPKLCHPPFPFASSLHPAICFIAGNTTKSQAENVYDGADDSNSPNTEDMAVKHGLVSFLFGLRTRRTRRGGRRIGFFAMLRGICSSSRPARASMGTERNARVCWMSLRWREWWPSGVSRLRLTPCSRRALD